MPLGGAAVYQAERDLSGVSWLGGKSRYKVSMKRTVCPEAKSLPAAFPLLSLKEARIMRCGTVFALSRRVRRQESLSRSKRIMLREGPLALHGNAPSERIGGAITALARGSSRCYPPLMPIHHARLRTRLRHWESPRRAVTR